MAEFIEATIMLPIDVREKVQKLADMKEVSQEIVIIQLLEVALSRVPRKQLSKGKLPLDSSISDS